MDENSRDHGETRDTLDARRASRNVFRLSDTLQRSPQINPGLKSPVYSLYPDILDALDSINSQSNMGMRTLDLLDDTSEEGSQVIGMQPAYAMTDNDILERATLPSRHGQGNFHSTQALASHCNRRPSGIPTDNDAHQRLHKAASEEQRRKSTEESSPSLNGSTKESLHDTASALPYPAHLTSERRIRSPSHLAPSSDWISGRSKNTDRVFGAHALAHKITLQALMRDEAATEYGLQSLEPIKRASLVPPDIRMHDPRSPRESAFAPIPSTFKRTTVIPPPIDTSKRTSCFPRHPIRTPYPHPLDGVHHKMFGTFPHSVDIESPLLPSESILTISIRRSNDNSHPRITTLAIPVPNGFIAHQREHENRLCTAQNTTFDDAAFFHALRARYKELVGPAFRLCSARSLTRIVVSGPTADTDSGWHHSPRNPRVLAWKGLSDSFSEDKILQHYRKPALGESRYAFVQWAHRLAAAPDIALDNVDDDAALVRRRAQPEGLEFVVTWSVLRIALILGLVIALSIAAAVLWILLGTHTRAGGGDGGGFRGAGDRVGTSVLLGICVLLIGLSGICGWLGVSWLVL